MELGEYIAKYRKEAGITLDDLAFKSGVPKGTINKIIAGTTKSPTLETVCAIADALGKTINDFTNMRPVEKKAPSYSDGAIKLAKDYDTLDRWGKQALRELADTEIARMEDESRFLVETTLEPEPKIIPLYLTPAAAGYASPVFGEDYEDYTLTPDNPQGADFAVRLQGDSMEPYFPDGEVVFCNRNPLADGDIGVFVVDGTAVCKQYHKEGGVVYLFSLNRKRADVDVVLLPSGGQTLVCQGRVITKRRYPLPGK